MYIPFKEWSLSVLSLECLPDSFKLVLLGFFVYRIFFPKQIGGGGEITKKPCIQGSVICFLKKCWDGSFYLALPVIHLAWYCLGNLLFALGMAECRHGTGFRVLEQPTVEPLISLRFPRSGLDPKPNEISGSISTDFSGY